MFYVVQCTNWNGHEALSVTGPDFQVWGGAEGYCVRQPTIPNDILAGPFSSEELADHVRIHHLKPGDEYRSFIFWH